MRQKGVREKGGVMALFVYSGSPVGWEDPWMYSPSSHTRYLRIDMPL